MATAKKNTGAYHTRSGPSPWVLGFEGREVPSALKGAIRAGQVGGLMLFRDNLGNSVEEARSIREEILAQVPSGAPFLFCADEEGGLVHPTAGIRGPQGQPWTAVPSPQALGRLNRAADARFVGSILGDRLRELGIHVDFAPLLDLDTQPENGVIGSRSFGSDPGRVAVLGWAFVRGLASSRIVGCFKHYPGHGGTSQDSHRVLPVMEPKHRALHEKPFVDCLRRPSSDPAWLMTAHVDWGDGLPASLSRAVISRVTRKAKEHLVVTDSLDMGAVSLKGGAGEQALLAHNDVLLVARDWRAGLHSITSLEEKLGHDPALLAAVVRARSRIREPWASISRRRRGSERSSAELGKIEKQLQRLHRVTVQMQGDPSTLPKGPWLWIVPTGLPPYTDLRGWPGTTGKRRQCAEVAWVPETEIDWESFLRRVTDDPRPKLLATLFRGQPDAAVARRWEELLGIPGLEVVAHLVDSIWPNSETRERLAPHLRVAWASGPHRESLTGLAEALDLSRRGWIEREGFYFPVDI
ncbi:MAG: glycoside hydrolase family 3 protein [Candidatus Eisenbacteria bacterium]|uniref:beta-N-acetylhexosaminidase n=1 Tax=Eiseniibacteriota bacterium TaxID=2212470 RepID=A0A956LZ20_UNCEI|nr:glycoside hydrolase family 3 protein [Candidatus Eisenbacteria bacterium]